MSDLKYWSTAAASNTSAAPNGWPENMAPSGVNDAGREMMAALARHLRAAEWFDYDNTPTYVNATSFTVAGDETTRYHAGRRIQAFVGSSTLYGTIVSSSYSTATGVICSWDSGNLTSSLTSVALSILSFSNHATPDITASNAIRATSASAALNAVNAVSAQFATTASAALNATNSVSAQFATTASAALNAVNCVSAQFATTASAATTVGGFAPSTTPIEEQIPVVDASGAITFGVSGQLDFDVSNAVPIRFNRSSNVGAVFEIYKPGTTTYALKVDTDGIVWAGNGVNKFWHEGNDGPSSGLAAESAASAQFATTASAATNCIHATSASAAQTAVGFKDQGGTGLIKMATKYFALDTVATTTSANIVMTAVSAAATVISWGASLLSDSNVSYTVPYFSSGAAISYIETLGGNSVQISVKAGSSFTTGPEWASNTATRGIVSVLYF